MNMNMIGSLARTTSRQGLDAGVTGGDDGLLQTKVGRRHINESKTVTTLINIGEEYMQFTAQGQEPH